MPSLLAKMIFMKASFVYLHIEFFLIMKMQFVEKDSLYKFKFKTERMMITHAVFYVFG